MEVLCVKILRNCQIIPKFLYDFKILPSMYKGSDFSSFSTIYVIVSLISFIHSRECELILFFFKEKLEIVIFLSQRKYHENNVSINVLYILCQLF